MVVRDILQSKGSAVFTTVGSAMLDTIIAAMVEHNCGSLVVCEDGDPGKMLGIVTERDILRTLAGNKGSMQQIAVSQVMTREVIVGAADGNIQQIMGLMTERRIRHLPIVEADRLIGIISIGDVVKAQHAELTAENHYLKEYIQS